MSKATLAGTQNIVWGVSTLAAKRAEESIGCYTSHVTPRIHARLVDLVGEKCMIDCQLNDLYCKFLYDTGAQVSLISSNWLHRHLQNVKIHPVKELLDEHEIVLKIATDNDIPFKAYVPVRFWLPTRKETDLIIPFLVTDKQINEPILGYNFIAEITQNPSRYGVSEDEVRKEFEKAMPWVKNVSSLIKLIDQNSRTNIFKIKTRHSTIRIPAGSNMKLKCHAETGPIKSRIPVLFKPSLTDDLPEGLEVAESVLSIP